ncbi:MAG TPA: LysR family transcriptional regulator [Burkholderiaceae bacterium]
MQLDPNDLLIFAAIVDEGTLSGAAERLRLPRSTLSRRLSALEQALGERLLLRTTRKFSLTDFGMLVLEHARLLAAEVDATAQLAQDRQARPSGRLRVSMPADFSHVVMGPMLGRFVADYPAIALEIDLSSRWVDLIGEKFDAAIRIGTLANDATLSARTVMAMETGLYAAPAYLARHGTPQTPADLLTHATLRHLRRNGEAGSWTLTRGEERWHGTPPGRAVATSPELLTRLARTGAGIALVTRHFAAPYEQNGELVALLADWTAPAEQVSIVFPERRMMPLRTRVFIDAMAREFAALDPQHSNR